MSKNVRKKILPPLNQNLTWNSAQFDVFVHSKASLSSSVASASLGLEQIWFEKKNEQLDHCVFIVFFSSIGNTEKSKTCCFCILQPFMDRQSRN